MQPFADPLAASLIFRPVGVPVGLPNSLMKSTRKLSRTLLPQSWLMRVCAVLFAAATVISTPVLADDAEDVGLLIKSGQLDTASQRVDTVLAKTPKDVEMRFLKGLILTRQAKPNDAIAVFLQLTQDFPELPEPYNNLAVLYAGQGQYDKAKAALDMAIRANPNFAVAYENLGDVYAKLATQAYEKSLQIEGNNATAQAKLALAHDLGNYSGKKSTPAAAKK